MSDDDTYEIPLQDQRVFGAGIKRKRVQFVPSSTPAAAGTATNSNSSVADVYLNLVLPDFRDAGVTDAGDTGIGNQDALRVVSRPTSTDEICEVCHLPLSSESRLDNADANGAKEVQVVDKAELADHPTPFFSPHEASIAHQVCLQHSHPPSHIDRKRKGLHLLQSHGFDPDARQGLGAQGQGIQYPIKVKLKEDKLGIGAVMPEGVQREEKVRGLDAKKVRKMHEKDRRKAERLREMFYRNEDVEKYLGKG